jgi:hypothetical protein
LQKGGFPLKIAVTSTRRLTKLFMIAILSVVLVLTGLGLQTNQAHAATFISEQAIPFVFLDPEDPGFVPFPGLMTGYVGWSVAGNQVNSIDDGTTVTNADKYPVQVYVNSYIVANNGATTIKGTITSCLVPQGAAAICYQNTQPVAITSPTFQHVEVATTDGAGLIASNNFTHNWN